MFRMPMLPQPDVLNSTMLTTGAAIASDPTRSPLSHGDTPDPVRQLERVAADALTTFQSNDPVGLHHRCSAALHELFSAIERAEPLLPAEEMLKRLQLVRRAIGSSPLAWRLQNWPRGYQGDFETIEMMCRGDSVSLLTGASRAIEQWALHCPPVQQHRNKITRQAALMRDVLLRPRSYEPARVLSIACGPSRDVRHLAPLAPAIHGEIWLNDGDLDALAYSRQQLEGTALRCHYVPGNVFRVYKALAAEGPFDLVLAGGLFDYLNDRQATHLIARVWTLMLKPGAQFFFTNIVAGHPYRACMEYVVSWTLLERTPEAIVALCEAAGVPASCVEVTTDETGLALLVTVTRE